MHPSRRRFYSIAALLCLAALMAACGGGSPPLSETPRPTGAEQTEVETQPGAAPTATEFSSPSPDEQSPLPTPRDVTEAQTGGQTTEPVEIVLPGKDPGTTPLIGEVPQDLLDAVFDDLLEQLDVSREAIKVEQEGAVVWRDGSLGCPQPGMMYTQALVPGYRIILKVGDEAFDYHASERGYFVLCEEGQAEEPLPPGGGSGPLVDQ